MWLLYSAVQAWSLLFTATSCTPPGPLYTFQLPPEAQWSLGLGAGLGLGTGQVGPGLE